MAAVEGWSGQGRTARVGGARAACTARDVNRAGLIEDVSKPFRRA